MFGRKKQGNTPAPAESKTYQDVRMEDWLDVVEASKTRSHTSFRGFFGKKNSEEYTAIESSLREVVKQMSDPLSSDAENNLAVLKTLMRAYASLIRACEAYGAKDGGTSSSGKDRKEMAEAICQNAKGDLAAVAGFYSQIHEERISPGAQANMSWAEILGEGREENVDLAQVDEMLKPAELPQEAVHDVQADDLQRERPFGRHTLRDHDMEQWLKALESSEVKQRFYERGFFERKTAKNYADVKDSMKLVLDSMNGTFSLDIPANLEMLKNASEAYSKLLSACDAYVAAKDEDLKKFEPFSLPGLSKNDISVIQIRKNIVKVIRNLAQEDLGATQQYYFDIYQGKMTGRQQAALTWEKILYSGREATIEVDNLHDDQKYKALGARNKQGDKASRLLEQGVFTKEEIEENTGGASNLPPGSVLHDGENNTGYGDQTNITNRNVATSRIALLAGVPGIVAESKTVKVKDRADGKIYKGNLMSIASGVASAEAEAEIRDKTAGTNQLEERIRAVSASFAPSVQKELTSLQVLDYICGQGDRHHNNFFLEKDENGKYAHVHAIDNDLSFATGIDHAKEIMKMGVSRSHLRLVVDEKGNLAMPYMDRQLAINLLYMTPDMVRLALMDLLGDKYIKNTVARLEKVQNAIRKEGLDSPKFKKDSEWNEDTAREMLEQSSDWKKMKKMQETGKTYKSFELAGMDVYRESGYFGEMMMRAMSFDEREQNMFTGITAGQ